MARYRSKDETDLRWNSIRRRATRELDIQIADWREKALNTVLTSLWEQYAASLSTGDVLELEAHYESFVGKVLDEVVSVTVDEAA